MCSPTSVGDENGPAADTPVAGPRPRVDYVQLTRFAAQQLYGPQRLASTLSGVHRLPIRSDPLPLVQGAKVWAEPLISWRGGDTYVTAVKLRNITRRAVTLDPRTLRGRR